MDPDAALRELRKLHADGGPDDFERAMELICELDAWLQRGGVLPLDWQPPWMVDVVEGLAFYANPGNYHAVAFMFDPPCGGFADDFDEDHGETLLYNRPMPGKRAREALAKARKEMKGGKD